MDYPAYCEHKPVHVFHHPIPIKWKELQKRAKGVPQDRKENKADSLVFFVFLALIAAKRPCFGVLLGRFFLGLRNFG